MSTSWNEQQSAASAKTTATTLLIGALASAAAAHTHGHLLPSADDNAAESTGNSVDCYRKRVKEFLICSQQAGPAAAPLTGGSACVVPVVPCVPIAQVTQPQVQAQPWQTVGGGLQAHASVTMPNGQMLCASATMAQPPPPTMQAAMPFVQQAAAPAAAPAAMDFQQPQHAVMPMMPAVMAQATEQAQPFAQYQAAAHPFAQYQTAAQPLYFGAAAVPTASVAPTAMAPGQQMPDLSQLGPFGRLANQFFSKSGDQMMYYYKSRGRPSHRRDGLVSHRVDVPRRPAGLPIDVPSLYSTESASAADYATMGYGTSSSLSSGGDFTTTLSTGSDLSTGAL